MGPREVLNKLKWHSKSNYQDSKIIIIHRGAPKDVKIIKGEDVLELGHSFMRVASADGEAEIPYHRIIQIEVHGKVLWRRGG